MVASGARMAGSFSNDERTFRVIRRLRTQVFDSSMPTITEKIKTQAVGLRLNLGQHRGPETYPLGGVNPALKNRILHTLTIILAHSGHAPQTASPLWCHGAYVVGHQYQRQFMPPAFMVPRFTIQE